MILLKNATYIDWQTLEFTEADILIEEGPNGNIKLFYPGEADKSNVDILDCSGKFVTKSFVNGHHHVYSALARGMPAPPKTPQNFAEILKYIWWRLDKALDLEMIEASALFTAMECAKNGATFVIDHHASPFAIEGSLSTIGAAFNMVGVSHLLCYEISDRDGGAVTQSGLKETDLYFQYNQGLVGLHASFTVSDATMRQAVDLAQKHNTGIHIHVAEDPADQVDAEKKHGLRVVDRLHKFGVLDLPKTILGHCLHIETNERKLLKQSPVWIAQNTESNQNNGVGHFNSQGLSPNIMLGTDGMHSDMLRSAKAAYFNGITTDPLSPMDMYNRFRNPHRYISENKFSGDSDNNLVVMDYPSPTLTDQQNFSGHFIYGLESKHIQHVISDGQLIVKDRRLTKVDEDDILKFSREMGSKLWERLI